MRMTSSFQGLLKLWSLLALLAHMQVVVGMGGLSGGLHFGSSVPRVVGDFHNTIMSTMNELKSSLRGGGYFPSFVQKKLFGYSMMRRRDSDSSPGVIDSKLSDEDVAFVEKLDEDNQEAYDLVMDLQRSTGSGWKHVVTTKSGVTVERRKMPTGSYTIASDAAAGAKHAGVKTTGVIKAPPEKIFKLFINNDRVREYNEHIVQVVDVDGIVPVQKTEAKSPKQWTKLAWSSSPKYGPLKARDFLSVVHFHKREDGSFVIINRPGYLSFYPVVKRFARATVLLAGNVIEPHPSNPEWSCVTQIAHVNPGGLADSKVIAKMINALCAKGPPAFFSGLEKAAQV